MPFEIVRNDITNMQVDAIVNTTNSAAEVGYGVDYAIHQKAGFRLLAARRLHGILRPAQAVITKGYNLPAKYVIHTVCPLWVDGSHGEQQLLTACYENALQTAYENGCSSIAFPLMSAGNLGFPKKIAMQIAMNTINSFLMDHEMTVYLVVFSSDTVGLSERLFSEVKSYIDEHYVRETVWMEYDLPAEASVTLDELQEQEYCQIRESARNTPSPKDMDCCFEEKRAVRAPMPKKAMAPPKAAPSMTDLESMLEETDANFSDTLMELIRRSGKKNSEIYNRALVDRKLFSKIRTKPNYTPEKQTILAFAIAMELNLEETKMLLERAGYALTHASKSDIIIEYFIKQKNYNILLINDVLYEFDQIPLGYK